MRRAQAVGTRASTKVFLPFRDGEIADRGPSGLTVTRAGGGPRLAVCSGLRDDGSPHASTADVLSVASLSIGSSDFTLDGAVYLDAPGSSLTAVAQRGTGGQNHVFALVVSGATWTFTVYNAAGTGFSVSNAVPFLDATAPGWHEFRCVVDLSAGLYLFRDGQLVGYTTSAPANLATTSLPSMTVGGEASAIGTSTFLGRLADVHLFAEADTEERQPARRVTRRHVPALVCNRGRAVHGLTWTASGAHWYVAGSDVTAALLGRDDIVSVRSQETPDDALTTWTEYGNLTDLDAAAPTTGWCWDAVNSRLVIAADPDDYEDGLLAVVVRQRWAVRGVAHGPRYHVPAWLTGGTLGERRCARWNEVPQQGAGATYDLARQALLDDPLSEEAGGHLWAGSDVRVYDLGDGVTWPAAATVFRGHVEAEPPDDLDTVHVQVRDEWGRFFRARAQRVLDKDTYPNADPLHLGYVWPTIYGAGHVEAQAVCIDSRQQPIPGTSPVVAGYRWKVTDHALSYAAAMRWKGGNLTGVYNLSLEDGCEFWSDKVQPGETILVDCDGYGTPDAPPADGTLCTFPYGDRTDCVKTQDGIWTFLLGLAYADGTSPTVGTSPALTAARGQVYRRGNRQHANPGDVVTEIGAHDSEALARTYHSLAGTWERKDIVKADARRIVRAVDLVERPRFSRDTSQIALTAETDACTYLRDVQGKLHVGDTVKRALRTPAKYRVPRATWKGLVEPSGYHTMADVVASFDRTQPLREGPTRTAEIVLSAAFHDLEVMDPLTLELDEIPAGEGRDYRPVSVAVQMDGTVAVELESESLHPDDSTSATSLRDPAYPFTRYRYRDATGTVSSATSWTRVGTDLQAMAGNFGPYPPNVSHRLLVWAKRTGGGANSDYQLRLVGIDDAGSVTVIASISGVGTTAAFVATTSFANIPTAKRRLQLQAICANGATGQVYEATWCTKETAGNADDPFPPDLVGCQGNSSGGSLTASTANTTVDANSAAGQKVLNVASTTGFSVDQRIEIIDAGGGSTRRETNHVVSIQAGVSLTLLNNLTYAHTAVQADEVYGVQFVPDIGPIQLPLTAVVTARYRAIVFYDGSAATRSRLSLSLFRWLQTVVPPYDGGFAGWTHRPTPLVTWTLDGGSGWVEADLAVPGGISGFHYAVVADYTQKAGTPATVYAVEIERIEDQVAG